MARDTATNANTKADDTNAAVAQDQENRINAQTQKYNNSLDTLEAGGSIAANPYDDSKYLAEQNLTTGAATSATNKGTADQLNTQALRTGENTGGQQATIASLSRNAQRTKGDIANTQNQANKQNYLGWEQYLLGSTLAPTQANQGVLSSATQTQDASLGNLTSIQNQQNSQWGQILGSAIGGGTAAAGNIWCYVAAAIYGGWDDARTVLIREWLGAEFAKRWYGDTVLALYARFGERISKNRFAVWLLKPLFSKALAQAKKWKG